jgi:hypothetical protein
MDSLNNYISQYREQLGKGHIQKAYKAIMTFMSGLGAYLGKAHPAYSVSCFLQSKSVPNFSRKLCHLIQKKLISFNPLFPPSFLNNQHTFIYNGKIILA